MPCRLKLHFYLYLGVSYVHQGGTFSILIANKKFYNENTRFGMLNVTN